jgi:hypothetical protein
MAKNGRPPKVQAGKWAAVTLRVPAEFKNHIIEVSDGYDMTITDYIKSLVERDAPFTSKSR